LTSASGGELVDLALAGAEAVADAVLLGLHQVERDGSSVVGLQ